jgi:hypothetical protein
LKSAIRPFYAVALSTPEANVPSPDANNLRNALASPTIQPSTDVLNHKRKRSRDYESALDVVGERLEHGRGESASANARELAAASRNKLEPLREAG